MDKFYWLNEHSRLTLERGYLSEGETPEGRIRDIADKAQNILGIEGFSDKFYDYMSRGFYSLSSPVWSNFGKSRGFSISCFGSNIEDNVASLLDAAGEVGMMSKHGGGTSGYFGKVRPRGAAITDNGESSGAVHFMKLFEQMTDTISQGCYDDQTDILTEKGWMPFEELILRKGENIKVAQVNDNDTISYVVPTDYMKFKPEDSELMLFKDSKNIDMLVTKNHNMEFKYDGKKTVDGKRIRYLNPEYRTATAEEAPLHRDVKYVHSSMLPSKGEDSGLTAMERLYIAIQADGNLVKGFEHSVKFRFSKKRKADRLEGILKELNLDYSYNHYTHSDDTYNIYVNLGHVAPKLLIDWVNVSDKSLEWANEFLDEISYWDGSVRTSEYLSTHYSSIIESNVDVVQMVAAVAGAKSRKTVNYRENEPTKSTIFNIYVTGRSQTFGVEKLEPTLVEYDGYVYCVEVPSHRLIVRRNGHTLVCGNSTRRGRFTPYLPIDHGDIHEFLEIGTEGNPIQDMTYAVTISDDWMSEMVNGDEEKRELWAKVLTRRTQLGFPYILFEDNANNNTVDVYKDKGLRINHSNLCVAPYTKILTDSGYKEIGSLKDEVVNVWNGEEWSEVTVKQTGTDKDMMRVTTSSGMELDSTPYHKYYVLESTKSGKRANPPRYREVQAKDLRVGDKLIKFDLPVIEGEVELQYAYDNGFYTGDGTVSGKSQVIYLYGEKKHLKNEFETIDKWSDVSEEDRIVGVTKKLRDKYFVPTNEYTIGSRLEWLAGYLDADGTVTNNDGSQSLQAASINKEFLQDVQLMLQTLGVDSKISMAREAGVHFLPANDGTGGSKEYRTKRIYRILINGNSLYSLIQLGINCRRLKWEVREPNRECSHFIKVTGIEELSDKMDTYCFTEPKRNMGMFNGILTGQCSEIMLPNNEEWSFVCNLSSMNLERYDEWKDTDAVETMVYFLDAVMSEFISDLERMRDSDVLQDRESFKHMEKAYNFAKSNRALGLGALGWHSYLQSKLIPFESVEADRINAEIFSTIKKRSYKASEELAELFGEPELLKGYGRRNATLNAVAPTTSSSFILGQVSKSIEPFMSNYFVVDTAKAKKTMINEHLVTLLEAKGKHTDEVMEDIRNNDGSVQHLDFLSEREKEVFKTYGEINQYNILEQASTRQQFIDQGQSLNLMVNPQAITAEQLNELHLFAWANGLKSLYYQHGTNAAQQFNLSKLCINCEA